jgi:hypothetical protein
MFMLINLAVYGLSHFQEIQTFRLDKITINESVEVQEIAWEK